MCAELESATGSCSVELDRCLTRWHMLEVGVEQVVTASKVYTAAALKQTVEMQGGSAQSFSLGGTQRTRCAVCRTTLPLHRGDSEGGSCDHVRTLTDKRQ